MDIEPKWLTSEHLTNVVVAGGFKAETVRAHETVLNWRHESLQDLLKALSSPLWTAQFCKGWSEEEMRMWKAELPKQLATREQETCTLEMVAHICVAQRENE